ncbi:MAG: alpha/beta hydrolase family protein [Pyrinomonadaceae bacterium]
MAVEEREQINRPPGDEPAPRTVSYDPFARGPFPVGVRTFEAFDEARGRRFPCEIWYPADARHAGQDTVRETQDAYAVPLCNEPRVQAAVRDAAARRGTYPLVIFSHGSSRGARRMSTFLCSHLASHAYLVAALDHSEVVAAELAPRAGETKEERGARAEAMMSSRVPDVRFLLERMLGGAALDEGVRPDSERVGVAGYSFGGWTVLAAPDEEPRIRAVVALAPAGGSRPKPGILPAKLNFEWGRDVPTLYLVGDDDTMTPLDGMREMFKRTPATKRMVILRRADHAHFLDYVEQEHEAARTMTWPGELSWIPKEMRPVAELCTGEEAHIFVRGLALCHFDAHLKGLEEARRFLSGDLEAGLAARGVGAYVHEG